jgi:GNAT superfamily N-acetyltransferase
MQNYWRLSHKQNSPENGGDLMNRIASLAETQVATAPANELLPSSQPSVSRSSFEIAPATEIPEAALIQFYRQMYPERAAFLAEHWRWLYRIGEYDWAPAPLIALDGPTVVGHIGTIPVCLRAGEDVRPAIWDVDLAVLPEYQGRKVGTKLMQRLREQCSLHVAFGNEKSTGTVAKIGWQLSTETRSFQLLLRPEFHPKFRQTALAAVGRLGGLMTRLVWAARAAKVADLIISPVSAAELVRFSQPPSDGALHVMRSHEFWTWRVLDHPRAAEHCVLRYPVNATTEYALLARRSEQDGFRRLHLLSLVAEPFNADELARFFASVVRWCMDEEIHRVLFVTSRPAIARVAQTWFPITSSLRFLACATDQAGWQYLYEHPHHWECLDDDFDLAV